MVRCIMNSRIIIHFVTATSVFTLNVIINTDDNTLLFQNVYKMVYLFIYLLLVYS